MIPKTTDPNLGRYTCMLCTYSVLFIHALCALDQEHFVLLDHDHKYFVLNIRTTYLNFNHHMKDYYKGRKLFHLYAYKFY